MGRGHGYQSFPSLRGAESWPGCPDRVACRVDSMPPAVSLDQRLSHRIPSSAVHLVDTHADSETRSLRDTKQEAAHLRPGGAVGDPGHLASALVASEAVPWTPEMRFQARVWAPLLKRAPRAGLGPRQVPPLCRQGRPSQKSSRSCTALPSHPVDLRLTVWPPGPGSLGDSLEESP